MPPRASRRLRLALAAAQALGALAAAEAAWAEPRPVHVLEIDSDDVEDQAEALTAALRSRIRATAGLSLAETSQTGAVLFLALRCPPRPDAACLQRVGDHLKASRVVWGAVHRTGASQVTAELHLWTRGAPEVTATEAFSDNLKDPGDESLRRVAGRLIDRLTGVETSQVPIAASVASGTVLVDGQAMGSLEHGHAYVLVPAGPHEVEVRAPGYEREVMHWDKSTGSEPLAFTLRPIEPRDKGNEVPVRAIVTWSALGVGAIGIGVSVVETVRYFDANSQLDSYRKSVPSNITDVCSVEAQAIPDAVFACRKATEARAARDIALVTGTIGVVSLVGGLWLYLTEPRPAAREGAETAHLRVAPRVGPGATGLDVYGTF
jgi:hypothetical protein